MMKSLVIVMLFMMLPQTSRADDLQKAQTAADTSGVMSAKGQVIGPSNEPQAGVPVQIIGPPGKTIAITDKSGTWSLYNLPAGDYQVKMVGSDASNTDAVSFSVKAPTFWDKVTGGKDGSIVSPALKLDKATR
jgi:hypothetical protein